MRWKDWVKKKIGFYISTGKWDNVSIPQLNAWLGNFDEKGQKWALALLNNFIYYPNKDVKQLCRYGLTKVIFRDQLQIMDQNHDFCCIDDALYQVLTDRIKEIRLVPLTSGGNITQSGYAMARIYTTLGFITEQQVVDPDKILHCIEKKSCKQFIFVDDFMGTGEQLESFWNQPVSWLKMKEQNMSLAKIAEAYPDITFNYLVLVATVQGLKYVENRVPRLKVFSCEKLSEEYRVFGNDSIFFENAVDRMGCRTYLEDLCRRNAIGLSGYRDLDFALAFSHGAPDSCLPLFWVENVNWAPLFRRRM